MRQYKAIISDASTNAADRLELMGAVYKISLDGGKEKVADLGQDLWDTSSSMLIKPIDVDEAGASRITMVWTGTTSGGDGDPGFLFHCSDWTSASGKGSAGDSSKFDGSWIEDPAEPSCGNTYALYCISQ